MTIVLKLFFQKLQVNLVNQSKQHSYGTTIYLIFDNNVLILILFILLSLNDIYIAFLSLENNCLKPKLYLTISKKYKHI